MQNNEETNRGPSLDAAAPEPRGLPFEFEDLSDGSHQRAIEEVQAAWRWVQGRRAMGLLPS